MVFTSKFQYSHRSWQIWQYWSLPVILVVVWQGLFQVGWIKAMTLPPPTMIMNTFWSLLISGELLRHIAISLLRVMEGFILASLVAVVLGIGIGMNEGWNRRSDLIIQVLKPIPPIAWIPLAILWLGIDESSKIFIIFLGTFFPVLVNVVDGVRSTDNKLVEVARILETSNRDLIFKVVFPSTLPYIMTGLRVGLGVAWMCVVAAELIAASSGIGYLIMDARQLSQADVVLVGMLTIGIVGKLMDSFLFKVEKRLIKWKIDFNA
ncbi:MAG TPA: ABC transporter permease [Syntrophomonadaceae bacterium]|nr:ABC transporter permease [Syntrophomonadaceae bacterium]